MQIKVAERKEHHVCNEANKEIKQKINEPIRHNSEAIHPHHLDNFGLLLKHIVVQKDWQQKT